jgi:hypothetical protein
MLELRRVNAQLPTTALPVMTKSYPLPTYEEVAEWLCYCPVTGDLRWNKDRWYNAKAGDIAGTICPTTGYRRVRLGGKRKVQAHRLAWLLHYGVDPYPLEIDHIDGDRSNNAIGNLRAVTRSQNQFNRQLNQNNTSGFKGVYCVKGRWLALVTHEGQRQTIGRFDTAEEAAAAWRAAASAQRGLFYRD